MCRSSFLPWLSPCDELTWHLLGQAKYVVASLIAPHDLVSFAGPCSAKFSSLKIGRIHVQVRNPEIPSTGSFERLSWALFFVEKWLDMLIKLVFTSLFLSMVFITTLLTWYWLVCREPQSCFGSEHWKSRGERIVQKEVFLTMLIRVLRKLFSVTCYIYSFSSTTSSSFLRVGLL